MRIRTIKPEFWQNEKLGALSRELRMFAAALLNVADDEGYFRTHPALIAGAVLPFDSDGQKFVKKALPELARIGFIELFDGGVGRVPKFSDHQRLSRVTPSRLKDKKGQPLENSHLQNISGNVSQPQEMFVQEVEVEVEVEQGSGRGTGNAPAALVAPVSADAMELEVFEHWRDVMAKTAAAQFTRQRREKVRARLAEGRTVEDLKRAIDGCSVTPHNIGQNDTGERWDDLELICRNGGNVERFMRNAQAPPRPKGTAPPRDTPVEFTEGEARL